MAAIPVSLFFEILLTFLGIIFMEGLLVRRLLSIAMFLTVVAFILQAQVFIIENNGVLTVAQIGMPTSIVRPIAGLFIFITIIAALRAYQAATTKGFTEE